MSVSSLATGAYQNAARLAPGAAVSPVSKPGAGSFRDVLSNAVEQLSQTTRNGDKQTQALAAGKADLIDVVTAVNETEVAIESLVAVRDKVIQAYDEIMRMPI